MPSRVAEILIEAAREQARAREQTGQIWGQTVANLGQVPGQIMAQQAQLREQQALASEREQRAQVIGEQLNQFKQARQTEAAVRGVLQKHASELIDQNTGHWNPPDAAITQELMQTSPQAAEQWMDYSTKFREHDQKMQDLHLAQMEARNNKWADDVRTVLEAPEDQRANIYAVRHGAWATMFPNDQVFKALPPVYTPEAAPLLQSVQRGLESESQRIARQQKAAEIAKANRIETKPGEKVSQYDPLTGTTKTIAEGAPKVQTEAEIALDAATLGTPGETPTAKQSKAALDALQGPRVQAEKDLASYRRSELGIAAGHLAVAQAKEQREKAGGDQNKLEQQYRTVLARGLSSRSGGLGLEDSKVQQANHLLALMDQNYDPKTKQYNIPAVQQEELALGLARLTSPTGQVGVELASRMNQPTAYGKMQSIISYVSGTPQTGSTQAVFQMFRDSIKRQGEVAHTNRDAEMRYLRGLAPTELEETRRQKLEENTLGPLRAQIPGIPGSEAEFRDGKWIRTK